MHAKMLQFNRFLALIKEQQSLKKKFAHEAKTLNFLYIKFLIFHILNQMWNTIFFLIFDGFKGQSFPIVNVETWQRAQIRRVVEWLWMDLHFITNQLTLMTWTSSANYIFGEMLLLGIVIQDWFAVGTKQSNFNLIFIQFQ